MDPDTTDPDPFAEDVISYSTMLHQQGVQLRRRLEELRAESVRLRRESHRLRMRRSLESFEAATEGHSD